MSDSASLARAQSRLGLRIIPDGRNDRQALIQLIENVYPDGEMRRPEYLHWEYDLNPAGQAVVRIGEKEGRAVGQYAVIPLRYQIGVTEVRGSLSLNTLTHAEFRGKGVFMLLAEAVFKECTQQHIQFTLGFPNPNSYKGFVKHLHFKDIGELPLWIRPMNLSRLSDVRAPRDHKWVLRLFRIGHPFWKLWTGMLDRLFSASDVPVQPINAFDDSFTHLWNRVKAQYPCILIRDRTYLEWRFKRHPTRDYQIFIASNDRGLMGYAITRIVDIEGIRCGMIVDMLTEKTSYGRKIARSLASAAIAHFQEARVNLSGSLMPTSSPGASAFWRLGYLPCPTAWLPQKFQVILRWHSEEPGTSPAQHLNQWYLTMGDYDAI